MTEDSYNIIKKFIGFFDHYSRSFIAFENRT